MGSVAVGIMCKTPAPGLSKTRLSPPLRPDECAAISACFIRDQLPTNPSTPLRMPARTQALSTARQPGLFRQPQYSRMPPIL